MNNLDSALIDLKNEINRARVKFPDTELMYAALCEEVGELANAVIEGKDWKTEALLKARGEE